MSNFWTLLREDQSLQFAPLFSFSKPEHKETEVAESGAGAKSLLDLKKELQELNGLETRAIVGGRTFDKDQWNTSCGGIVPQ